MAHTLFDEGLVRLWRLQPHVARLDALRDALQAFSPEAVAAHCAIASDVIRSLARELATSSAGCVYARIGSCTQTFGTLASWLVDVLNVLTGHLDAPGGAMLPRAAAFAHNTQGRAGVGRGVATGRHHSHVSGAPEVWGELPMTLLAEEMLTPGAGQVRALITVASNPVLSSPGGTKLAQALEDLDFMVSVDLYVNETTRHADVILPGQSPLEHSHYDVAFPQLSHRNHARYSAAVFEPAANHPPEWQVMLRLAAIAKGQGARTDVLAMDDELVAADVAKQAGAMAGAVLQAVAPLRGPERLLDLSLRGGPHGDLFGMRPDGLTLAKVQAVPGGIDLGALTPRIPEVLRTESGRIELAPAMLLADLPRALAALHEPTPELVVIVRRDVRSNNSWMHNLSTLAKGPNRCTALVHPQDAARAGVTDAGRARLSGAQGAVEVDIEISSAMMPGTVCLPHGWGHDDPAASLSVAAQRPGVNLNELLDDRLRDPLPGNAVLSGVAVVMTAL